MFKKVGQLIKFEKKLIEWQQKSEIPNLTHTNYIKDAIANNIENVSQIIVTTNIGVYTYINYFI